MFGVVLLWVAGTGVASHIAAICQDGGIGMEKGPPPPIVAQNQSLPGPKKRSVFGLLHQLHDGETFGPVGAVISLAGGIALLFFAGSGLWTYFDMSRRRRRANKTALFWD